MEEEIKQEEKKPTMLEDATNISTDLKQQLDRAEKTLTKMEELKAIDLLGGKTDAATEPEKKEEDPKQYGKDVLAGKYNE